MGVARRRLLSSLVVIFIVNLCIISAAQCATYRVGSAGETVRQVQERLAAYGYSPGPADGIYDTRTASAVRRFQAANALTADGVAEEQTLAALGIPSGASAQAARLDLLARVITAEAGGEPYAAQVALGAVIFNRVKHPSFPADLAAVIYQPGAFSCVTDGRMDTPAAQSAIRAAYEAAAGSDPTGGAVYFYRPDAADGAGAWGRELLRVIGSFRFCK